MLEIYIVIAAIYSWFTWSRIQGKMGIAVLTSINQYIIGKMILCAFTGWFIMPIDILMKIINSSLPKEQKIKVVGIILSVILVAGGVVSVYYKLSSQKEEKEQQVAAQQRREEITLLNEQMDINAYKKVVTEYVDRYVEATEKGDFSMLESYLQPNGGILNVEEERLRQDSVGGFKLEKIDLNFEKHEIVYPGCLEIIGEEISSFVDEDFRVIFTEEVVYYVQEEEGKYFISNRMVNESTKEVISLGEEIEISSDNEVDVETEQDNNEKNEFIGLIDGKYQVVIDLSNISYSEAGNQVGKSYYTNYPDTIYEIEIEINENGDYIFFESYNGDVTGIYRLEILDSGELVGEFENKSTGQIMSASFKHNF